MLWAEQAQRDGSPCHVELPGLTLCARYCISRVSRYVKSSKVTKALEFQLNLQVKKEGPGSSGGWLCGLQSNTSISNQFSQSKKTSNVYDLFSAPHPFWFYPNNVSWSLSLHIPIILPLFRRYKTQKDTRVC